MTEPSDPIPSQSLFFNTTLSFAGQAVSAILALVAVPIYIRILGMEAFGLIAFYITLQTIVRALDLGMTPTVIREIARARATTAGLRELADQVRTFEIVFATSGAAIALVIVSLSPWLANNWIQVKELSRQTVATCVLVMGLQCGITWLSSYYQNALLGMEHQVTLNAIRIAELVATTAGAIVLLVLVAPDIQLLFYWQALTSLLALLIYAFSLRRLLPSTAGRPRFRASILRRAFSFASGMAFIVATGLVLSSMDKIYLSTYLSLDDFGNYAVAFLVISTLATVFVVPFYAVMLPRFTLLLASEYNQGLRDLYHLVVQLVCVILVPTVLVLTVFDSDLFATWLGNSNYTPAAEPLLRFMAGGMLLNSLMVPAYLLQLAAGWTSLGIRLNVLLILLFVPALLILTQTFGPVGAAANYLGLNLLYLCMGLPLTHRRILPGALRSVLLDDLLPVFLVCSLGAGLLLLVPYSEWSRLVRLGFAGAWGLGLLLAAAVVSGRVRGIVSSKCANARASWRGTGLTTKDEPEPVENHS
ncbi:MAG: oligosaccharide flippase family protein [Gemmataceae bacterium]|nr:oligosaccharide flippase family protein [Gemmataceae bacterium]